MSVKIRLRRDGAKKRPFYHLVAADSRRARDGRYIEQLGYYNPIVAAETESIVVLKEDRVRYWLSVGAQPSDTAAALLKSKGLMARSLPRPVKEVAPAATAETTVTEEVTETEVPAPADTDTPETTTEEAAA